MNSPYDDPADAIVIVYLLGCAILCYPVSVALMGLGLVGKGQWRWRWMESLRSAASVAKDQAWLSFFAWIACVAVCFMLFIAAIFVGGALVWMGALEPPVDVLSPPLLAGFLVVHVIGQATVYYHCLRATASGE